MNSNALFSTRTLTLMSAGIAINMVLGQIASMLKLPIFLDSIGTIIVALLAGPIAALVAGLTTNLIWGLLTSPIAAAFAPVAAIIGLVSLTTPCLVFQPANHHRSRDRCHTDSHLPVWWRYRQWRRLRRGVHEYSWQQAARVGGNHRIWHQSD